jgi:hypothetical protein
MLQSGSTPISVVRGKKRLPTFRAEVLRFRESQLAAPSIQQPLPFPFEFTGTTADRATTFCSRIFLNDLFGSLFLSNGLCHLITDLNPKVLDRGKQAIVFTLSYRPKFILK